MLIINRFKVIYSKVIIIAGKIVKNTGRFNL